jgi:hypothetical protein
MNKLQLELSLEKWLKESAFQTQKEFGDRMSTLIALKGVGLYQGEAKESLDNEMEKIKFKFNWLESQIKSLNESWASEQEYPIGFNHSKLK